MSIDAVTVYESTIVNQENLDSIDWDENYFKWCDFVSFGIEGGVIVSDFVRCSFKDVDWYSGLFTDSNFINCEFENCIFRGTSFPDSRFIECILKNCRFVKDNMDSDCDFERTAAYRCTIEGGEGFKAEVG